MTDYDPIFNPPQTPAKPPEPIEGDPAFKDDAGDGLVKKPSNR